MHSQRNTFMDPLALSRLTQTMIPKPSPLDMINYLTYQSTVEQLYQTRLKLEAQVISIMMQSIDMIILGPRIAERDSKYGKSAQRKKDFDRTKKNSPFRRNYPATD